MYEIFLAKAYIFKIPNALFEKPMQISVDLNKFYQELLLHSEHT